MAVSDGQRADQVTFNNAFMSRTQDTNTQGKIDLDNTDAESGATISNAQRSLNGAHSFTGSVPEGLENQTPTWASDNIGTANENVKDRVDSVQAQVEVNTNDIANKPDRVNPSTDNAIVRFDDVGGNHQDSGVTIDDTDNMNIPGSLDVVTNLDVGGNTIITGDLTVNGTTTTVNTSTLDVTDANITVNDGGTQASADLADAGITVEMSDANDAIIGYDSTLVSRFKVGDVGSESEIITRAGQQVIENKDIDGGTASNTSRVTLPKNTTVALDALTRKEGTIFYDQTEQNFFGDDGTNIIPLGGGSGGSGVPSFVIDNSSTFETGIGNWVTAANTAEDPTPEVNPGGSVSAGFEVTQTTVLSEVLIGEGSGKFSKPALDVQGHSWRLPFEIDLFWQDKELDISFKYETGAGYTTDYYRVFIKDVTNGTIINVNEPGGGDGSISTSTGSGDFFTGKFQTASNSINYELIIHAALPGNTTAFDMFVDDVFVFGATEEFSASEYIEVDVVSRPVTTTANTAVFSTETITLTAGTWDIGFDIPLRIDENSGTNNNVSASVFLDESSVAVEATKASLFFTTLASSIFIHSISRVARITLGAGTTYRMGIICSDSSATAEARIEDPDYTTAITGNLDVSKMWARRVE